MKSILHKEITFDDTEDDFNTTYLRNFSPLMRHLEQYHAYMPLKSFTFFLRANFRNHGIIVRKAKTIKINKMMANLYVKY